MTRNMMMLMTSGASLVLLLAGTHGLGQEPLGRLLTSNEMLEVNGRYSMATKCTETCDHYNKFDQTCFTDPMDGGFCSSCTLATQIEYPQMAGPDNCEKLPVGSKATS